MSFRPSHPLAALAVVAGCASSPTMLQCAADADCGAGNLCVQGACAANAPPTATFETPVGATTHRLFTLVPASRDPEGRPVRHRWAVKATAAGCAADAEPTASGSLEVVFWCAGSYEVTLVPIDDLGAEGVPVVRALEVAAASGAPTVTAGAAIAATHRCDQAVPSCLVVGPGGANTLQLAASASDPGGGAIVFEWRGIPPPAPAKDPALLLSFVTSSASASPVVGISNGSGGPIAGLYRFRVRARNPQGLLGQAFQEVAVANSPPTVRSRAAGIPHTFLGGSYVAEAVVRTDAFDSDGDALKISAALDGAPVEGCLASFEPSSAAGYLRVRVACSSAAAFTASRWVSAIVRATDGNGGSFSGSWSFLLQNRPPQIGLKPSFADGLLAVDHRAERCTLSTGPSCFVADGSDPFVVADPEGDPVATFSMAPVVSPTQPQSKGTVSLTGASLGFRFESPVTAPLEFRSSLGLSGFALQATATDALGGTANLTVPLSIRNRPPFVKEPSVVVAAPHVYDPATLRYVATARGALFEDPDGDPLLPIVTRAGSCGSATITAGRATITCERSYDWRTALYPPLASFLAAGGVLVTASDGWEGVSSATWITIEDRPPTLSVPATTIDNCACVGTGWTGWVVSGSNATLPVVVADPDGDPAYVKADGVGTEYPPPPSVCLPGTCLPVTNLTVDASTSVTVTADTGASAARAAVKVDVSVACSKSGTGC